MGLFGIPQRKDGDSDHIERDVRKSLVVHFLITIGHIGKESAIGDLLCRVDHFKHENRFFAIVDDFGVDGSQEKTEGEETEENIASATHDILSS